MNTLYEDYSEENIRKYVLDSDKRTDTITAISDITGYSFNEICEIAGVNTRRTRESSIPQDWEPMIRDHANGIPSKVISARYGVHYSTVNRRVRMAKNHGVYRGIPETGWETVFQEYLNGATINELSEKYGTDSNYLWVRMSECTEASTAEGKEAAKRKEARKEYNRAYRARKKAEAAAP